jgi:3',5'-cyclic AMP phosphodiesterase CpdA
MRPRLVRRAGFLAAILIISTPAWADKDKKSGFPLLPPVPQTGQLKNDSSATKFCFIEAGDNRPKKENKPQPEVLSQLFSDAQKFKPVFFLWSGDIIYGHETKKDKLAPQYQEFFDIARLAKAPVFNAPGNHEMDTITAAPNEKIETPDPEMLKHYLHFMQYPKHSPAYGAFDYGNSRFIAMNTEEVGGPPAPTPTATPEKKLKLDPGFVSQEQMKLLKDDLEANKDKAHIFVFMHHPIKPLKKSAGLYEPNANELEALFENYPNVSHVIAAHEHLYYKPPASSKGPTYLVSGGAGAPLDNCDGDPNCQESNHYLVFNVDKDKVDVQMVPVGVASSSPAPNN